MREIRQNQREIFVVPVKLWLLLLLFFLASFLISQRSFLLLPALCFYFITERGADTINSRCQTYCFPFFFSFSWPGSFAFIIKKLLTSQPPPYLLEADSKRPSRG